MNITSFFALSNQSTNFFRCITPAHGRGAAPSLDDGIFPPTNNQGLSLDYYLAIFTDDRQKAIFSRPLLDSEAVAQVSKVHTVEIATECRT